MLFLFGSGHWLSVGSLLLLQCPPSYRPQCSSKSKHYSWKPKVNIVFLTTEIVPRFYLINQINERHPIAKVFFQTKYSEPLSWTTRAAKLLRSPAKIRNIRYVCREFAEKLLFAREYQLKTAYETKRLFNDSVPRLTETIAFERVYSM